MANRDPITVRKQKYDGTVKSEWEGERLPYADSDWQLILHHPDRHRKITPDGVETSDRLFVHCCNRVRPLSVLFTYAPDGRISVVKCDAALPAVIDGDVISFVDLDLDLIVQPDRSYHLRDEGQFAVNQRKMDIPQAVAAQAQHGIALAEILLAARQFPFDDTFMPSLTLPPAQPLIPFK